jgi:hypothetical protein
MDNPPYRTQDLILYYIDKNCPECRTPGSLRPANASDTIIVNKWVADFYEETFMSAPPFDERIIIDEKTKSITSLYIWVKHNNPCAMGMLCEAGAGTRRLNLIYTPADLRRRGYAKAVVCALVKIVRDEGAVPFLYAAAGNAAANGLYRSLGFKEAEGLTGI